MSRFRMCSTSEAVGDGVRPVAQELTVHRPPVTGRIPEELDGSLLAIGPNPLGRAEAGRQHAFAGDGMVQGIRLRDGRAEWYRNRWLRTDRVSRELGELPTPGPRHGLSDNANANLVSHAGRTLALGDGGILPIEVGPELETVARVDFDGTLPNGFSAHPSRDQLTGELHAVAYYHELPHVSLLTVDVQGRVRSSVPITVKKPSMMHAFSVTDRHSVLYDLPVTFNPEAARQGSRVPYTWDENYGARLGVLPLGGGDADVLWMDIDPCYVFHPVNAYESGRHIVLDVIRHQRVFDRDRLRPGESAPALWRWTVDTLSGTVVEEQLADFVEEFPRIDERYQGAPHRYAFGVRLRPGQGGALAGPALLRHDLVAGRTAEHRFGPGREGGEAVFVARDARAPEGDGWLLSLVYDAATDRSELVVLDTADFTGPPVAVVQLPVRVPHAFHAHWSPAR